jgi:hypothetical protein
VSYDGTGFFWDTKNMEVFNKFSNVPLYIEVIEDSEEEKKDEPRAE